MGKTYAKNGTPVGSEHLCKSCSWGHFVSGYRESDVLAFCTNTNPNFKVPFVVYKCSEYSDKYKPDWDAMTKLAIEIEPTRVSQKTTGFSLVAARIQEKPANDCNDESTTDDEAVAGLPVVSR